VAPKSMYWAFSSMSYPSTSWQRRTDKVLVGAAAKHMMRSGKLSTRAAGKFLLLVETAFHLAELGDVMPAHAPDSALLGRALLDTAASVFKHTMTLHHCKSGVESPGLTHSADDSTGLAIFALHGRTKISGTRLSEFFWGNRSPHEHRAD